MPLRDVREPREQLASPRGVVARHLGAAGLQQIEQQHRRQRADDAAAHELAQIQETLVVRVRSARQHDRGYVREPARECGLDELMQPAREELRLEHGVRRRRRLGTAASDDCP